jgi:hypothetical protein
VRLEHKGTTFWIEPKDPDVKEFRYNMRVHLRTDQGKYLRVYQTVALMDVSKAGATDLTFELQGDRGAQRAINYNERLLIRTTDGDAFFKVVEGDQKIRADDFFVQALFAFPYADPFTISPLSGAQSPVSFLTPVQVRLPPPADSWYWFLP